MFFPSSVMLNLLRWRKVKLIFHKAAYEKFGGSQIWRSEEVDLRRPNQCSGNWISKNLSPNFDVWWRSVMIARGWNPCVRVQWVAVTIRYFSYHIKKCVLEIISFGWQTYITSKTTLFVACRSCADDTANIIIHMIFFQIVNCLVWNHDRTLSF